ncbi:MAG: arsenic metallochaperone ArsD family protein [Fibrobacterales bacterium]
MKVVKVYESESFTEAQKESITTFLSEAKALDPLSILPARYSIEGHPNLVQQDDAVRVMVETQGVAALPITCVNDAVIGIGTLPNLDQVRRYIDNASTASQIDDCCGGGCCST